MTRGNSLKLGDTIEFIAGCEFAEPEPDEINFAEDLNEQLELKIDSVRKLSSNRGSKHKLKRQNREDMRLRKGTKN